MRVKYENDSLRGIFFCKNFQWKYIKNENHKSYLGNNEQKAMFLVVSWSDAHFSFGRLLFACPIGAQFYLRARKIGRVEENLSSPVYEKSYIKNKLFFQLYLKSYFVKTEYRKKNKNV